MAGLMSILSYFKHWELTCLLRYDLRWIKRNSRSRSVFTDPAANQTSNLVMLLREEGGGSASLFLPVSNRDLWISVCLLPWFLPLPVSWQSRLDAPRAGGNGATLPILHRRRADPVCLRCAVSIWPNLKQIGKMIVICRGAGAALFSTITFRKPFRRKKEKKIKKRIIQKAIFSQFPTHPARLVEKRCVMKHLILLCEMAEETQRYYSLSLLPSLWRMSVIKQGRWGIWRELWVSAIENRGALLENTDRNRPPTCTTYTYRLSLKCTISQWKSKGVSETHNIWSKVCGHLSVLTWSGYFCCGLGQSFPKCGVPAAWGDLQEDKCNGSVISPSKK